MATKTVFDKATDALNIIIQNKKLTDDNFSRQSANVLGNRIWTTVNAYIKQNLKTYRTLTDQDYNQRKKFVSTVLDILLEQFPSNPKPKIYFKEDMEKVGLNIEKASALFYSKELNPWATKVAVSKTGSDKPFFAFFNDFSSPGLLGQIVHEFTHYLQSTNQSTVSQDVIKQAAVYYQYYHMNKTKYKQIYTDSIHEVEANAVADYVKEQIKILNNTKTVNHTDYTM